MRLTRLMVCISAASVISIAQLSAGILALWNYNDSNFTVDQGSGICQLVNTASNYETALDKLDPNDPTGASLEISDWTPQISPNKTDGIAFYVSTAGRSNIKVKWDCRHNLKNGETAPNTMAFQYSTDSGSTWIDGPIWTGYGDVWYLNREVDLTGVPGVDNNPNFAFRLVAAWQPGAGKYMPCVGSVYGSSRKWRIDLVKVHDDPPAPVVNTIALWDFNDQWDMIADYGDGISFADLTGNVFFDGDGYSKDYPIDSEPWDISASSDPSLKGKGIDTNHYPLQGASSNTAGVQFNVSTVGYSGIKIDFDLKHKQDSSRHIRLEYTLNRNANPIAWIKADPLFDHFITEDMQTAWWFNNNTVDLSSVSGINNNPNFAFRIVTEFDPSNPGSYAASGPGRTYNQDPYYNKLRFDMIRVSASSALPAFPEKNIIDAKLDSDWHKVSLSDVVVTHNHPDYFWVETLDRACGLKIYSPQHDLGIGTLADVSGIMRTGRDGERYIYANNIADGGLTDLNNDGVVDEKDRIRAVSMNQKSLGGGGWNYNPATGEGQIGAPGCSGLNNIGILVRVCGRVTAVVPEDDSPTDLEFLYIDDGSGLNDGNAFGPGGTPALGIRVVLPKNFTGDYQDKYVYVEGVSSLDRLDSVSADTVKCIRRPSVVDVITEPQQ